MEQIYPIPAAMEGARCDGTEQYQKKYKESIEDPEKFWGKLAEQFTWQKKWDKVGLRPPRELSPILTASSHSTQCFSTRAPDSMHAPQKAHHGED